MFNKNTFLIAVGLLFSTFCLAQNDKIPIVIPPTNAGGDIHHPHAPAQPVVGGYYDMVSEELVLTFLTNLGTCVVTVTSDNGSYYQETFNTVNGTLIMSVPAVQGLYTVSIQTTGGTFVSTPFLIV